MQKLVKILKNPTSVYIYINTFGQYVNILFTVAYSFILFRIFSPAEYGVFSVLTSVSYLLSNVLDFGTTATIYSFLPALLDDKKHSLFRFIKSTFFYQSVFASIAVLFLLVFFPALDTYFLKTNAAYIDMAITALSIILFIWQNFLLNVYFAAKQFLKANLYINAGNVARMVGLGILYLTNSVSMTSVLIVLMVVGNVAFLTLVLFERKKDIALLWEAEISRKEYRFKYAITYFVASQFMNIGQRMDLFILSFFNTIISRADVGYYAAAQKIILTVLTTVISITQVLSPDFSLIKTQKEARKQMKHGLMYILLPCALFVGLIITPTWVYEILFTSTFTKAVDITRTISLPYLIYAVGSIPMLFLLYTIRKPKIILYSFAIFATIVTVGHFIFVPTLQLLAPPLIFAVAYTISTCIIAYAAYIEYKKLPKSIPTS